ncbi:MAG: DEAD/DEAH box helicase [Bacteroidales bacterium]|nr:DEAD/DEAH box helicase [Bacteroidales bacterium]
MINFMDSGLRPEILDAVAEIGFNSLTPIQEKTIPVLLHSKGDLVGLAQTGTGKTAAFGLPLIQLTDLHGPQIQTLVLCPTRELCIQISRDLIQYSSKIPGFRIVPVYGGANMEVQIKALKRGCQIVVGTPGRVLDLIRRKVLHLSGIRWLILDEADEMLNMGFKEDLDAILDETPKERQTLLFSATMRREVADIANKYMNNPEEISIGKRNAGAENIRHEYYMVHSRDRYLALKRIVDIHPAVYGIVFCRTRQETKDVASKLMHDGYNADALHGDLSQSQRDYAMDRFRLKNLQLLVATDVAARGLDVNNLTHIINYNLPDDLEVYIHRSGRTGRAGKSGVSVSIIHTRETGKIKDLERLTQKRFEQKPVPGGKEVCEKQLFNLVDKVEKAEVDEKIEPFLPAIYKKLEWLSREELIKHFISEEFNRFLSYYKEAPDLNVKAERSNDRGPKGKNGSYSRFFTNLGSKNGMDAGGVISLINKHTKGSRIEIGKIDIMKKFSFFEVAKRNETEVLSALKKANFKGIPVVVQLSKPDNKGIRQDSNFPGKKNRKRTTSNYRSSRY